MSFLFIYLFFFLGGAAEKAGLHADDKIIQVSNHFILIYIFVHFFFI